MPIRYVGYGFRGLRRFRVGRVSERQPELVDVDDALCVPLAHLPGAELGLTGGIFRSDGGYVPAAGLVTGKRTIVGPGSKPLPPASEWLSGRSLYLGPCHYHYGHFLVETLSRLWCVGRRELETFDHILLLPLNGHVSGFVREFFELLGVADRLRVVDAPKALESVCVPAPAIRYPGTVHRDVASIGALFGSDTTAKTAQPLFLSRAALVPGHHRVLIGEHHIERVLAGQGVRIFRPERHTVAEQIAAFREHRVIIGFAGSALHTLIPAGGRRHVIAYSARPAPAVFPLLDMALLNDAMYIQAGRGRIPGQATVRPGFSPEIIDPRPVLATLRAEGVIGRYELGSYGTAAADVAEARRYNTALILRRALEASQQMPEADCHAEVAVFRQSHALDLELLAQAREGSELMRRFFPEP